MEAKKERFFFFNTLASMLSGAIGYEVTVEMKNDSRIDGILQTTDGYMNMSLACATVTLSNGKTTSTELINVKGSNVRYVHMPPQLNPVTAMRKEIQNANRPLRDQFQPKKYSKLKTHQK